MADVNPEASTETDPPARTLSRRKMLGSLAAGSVVLGVPGVAAAQETLRGRRRGPNRGRGGPEIGGGRPATAANTAVAQDAATTPVAGPAQFSRIFRGAEPFDEVDDELTAMLATLGAPGGLLDAKDPLEEGPIRLITELELSANNANNPNHTAGTTFIGQFLDHDITNDAGSTLGQPQS